MKKSKGMKRTLFEYSLMTMGCALFAVSIHYFTFINSFAMGGVAGIALVLNAIIPAISISIFNNVINIAFILLGFVLLSKDFGFKTVYCSVMYIVLYQALVWIDPISVPLTDNKLLELLFSILISAIAGALIFNLNASAGGTDVIAMVIKKYFGLDVGIGMLISNAFIVLFSFFLFDMETALLSLLGLILKAVLVDGVIESINRRKMLNIITTTPDVACDFIINELKRSATVWQGVGAYTQEGNWVVLTVLTPRQAVSLRQHLRQFDPSAFFLASKTSEIFGKGFHQP